MMNSLPLCSCLALALALTTAACSNVKVRGGNPMPPAKTNILYVADENTPHLHRTAQCAVVASLEEVDLLYATGGRPVGIVKATPARALDPLPVEKNPETSRLDAVAACAAAEHGATHLVPIESGRGPLLCERVAKPPAQCVYEPSNVRGGRNYVALAVGKEQWPSLGAKLTPAEYGATAGITYLSAAPPPSSVRPARKATIEGDQLKVPGRVEFDVDRATIREDAQTVEVLTTVLETLRDNPTVNLRVEGHTDDTGNAAHNKSLSSQRAEAVVAWLAAHGIDRARLTAVGVASQRPLFPNDTPEHKQENRRTEFHLVGPAK